ncbi:MAG: response regulator transcription factor [Ramlibacter sp.]|uniref:response regulator transcription factor n=1 Tax=Ramlibacter sp. TaxID=1917967 RepID=UPI002627DD40|nr:response regulator transcription factor [Ramlibacter sp.]MDH4377994.1 response regulator transcription factor [Ramlibacter sp.]
MNQAPSLQILVVEDNDNLREATVGFLQEQGHQVVGVVCAEDVDDTPTQALPDLYLIDVNLPGEDGFSLAKRIRNSQALAGIVMITARSQLNDRLDGYGCGADNYLMKPVDKAELLACVNNLARRLKPIPIETGFTLNTQTLCLAGPAGEVTLTHGESLLLAAFCRAASQTLERWQAMQLVDTKDKGLVAANLEMRISALRKKLSVCGASNDAIRTLRGVGYALGCQIRVI